MKPTSGGLSTSPKAWRRSIWKPADRARKATGITEIETAFNGALAVNAQISVKMIVATATTGKRVRLVAANAKPQAGTAKAAGTKKYALRSRPSKCSATLEPVRVPQMPPIAVAAPKVNPAVAIDITCSRTSSVSYHSANAPMAKLWATKPNVAAMYRPFVTIVRKPLSGDSASAWFRSLSYPASPLSSERATVPSGMSLSFIPLAGSFRRRISKATSRPGAPHMKKAFLQPSTAPITPASANPRAPPSGIVTLNTAYAMFLSLLG
mmetsp:Transcript_38558/g.70106  ORF Transcript_38558/g.70106 Transcript_38558/m.70106 type:complete len:266 (+) Transcript_38558:272-1069(+)